MGTFVYAPGIRIYIDTEHHGIVDVSEDIVDYTIQRRSDGPSTINFSIQNIKRKYDFVFTPNDRIIVELKRVTWLRVFTGLLNSVPLMTAWPRVVALSASCSLKRLQYWYWDPDLPSAFTEVFQAIAAGKGTADAGMTNVILTLLKEVVGWPESKVHIGAIPPRWFDLIMPYATVLAEQIGASDAYVASIFGSVGTGSVAGSTTGGSGTSVGTAPIGVFNTNRTFVGYRGRAETFDTKRLNNAEIIIRVGLNMGLGDNVILAALIAAIGESRLDASAQNRTSSASGLFQQLSAWGSLEERLDPTRASRLFYNAAKNTKGYTSLTPQLLAADVQGYRHGTGDNSYAVQGPRHNDWLPMAQTLLAEFKQKTSLGAVTGSNQQTGDQVANAPGASKPVAYDFAAKALDLVQRYPNIPYGSSSERQIKSSMPPSRIGCSGFVSWVLYNVFGRLPAGWSLQWAEDQWRWCRDHGGQTLTIDEALKTQGALLIRHPVGGKVGHIEITVGDGKTTVAATSQRDPAGIRQYGLAYYRKAFDTAILMPWFDYTNARNGAPPTVTTNPVSYPGSTANASTIGPYSASQAFDGDNPFDTLFGDNLAYEDNLDQVEQKIAMAFSGPRALLNDQPLLPYIKNLVNSSLRSFCSAPNGDFMAWFPDYYGLWGTAAIMQIEPIELLDFYVEWSDDFLVTHQYAVAGNANFLDLFQGTINTRFTNDAEIDNLADSRVVTAGIASIDIPQIMWALFGIDVTEGQAETYRQWVYRKFGARPDFKPMDGMVGKAAELFSALYYFMRQWAYQYNANVPITFMPELWPGMLVQIPEYEFQAYVTTVTHSGQMGEGGGHSTSINVAAPARLTKNGKGSQNLIGLPIASGMLDAVVTAPAITEPESKRRQSNQAQVDRNAQQAGSG